MIDAPFLEDVTRTAWSVVQAVLPLVVIFLALQVTVLDLPRTEVARVLGGTLVASLGLFLFLLGVAIGFLPAGRAIGDAAASLPSMWLLLPFGAVLGFVTTWGEPAVRILAEEVEDASAGSIRRSLVVVAISFGVAGAVGLGLLRIAYEIPLVWLLVPGYAIVVAIVKLSDREFVSIAIDASGVATGPLANTFLLALALGVSSAIDDRDPLVHGLGLVALIALAPIISLMTLGLVARRRQPPTEARSR